MAIENIDQKIQGVYDNQANLYPLLKELASGSVPEDIYVDNCFVDEEFEFTDTDADFGTNAKAKISSAAKPEGTAVKATGQDAGKMLASTSSGTCEWRYPAADNFSSGVATLGAVLTANGSGGANWAALNNHASFSLSGTTLTITEV